MNRTEFEHLAEKFLKGNISPDEEQRLSEHYDALQKEEGRWDEHLMGAQEEVKDSLYGKIVDEIGYYKKLDRYNRRSNVFLSWKAAAVFTAIVSAAALFFYLKPPGAQKVKNDIAKQDYRDIGPGGSKAVLTLADGSQIALDSIVTGDQVYRVAADKPLTQNEQPVYNTISTPLRGQYQLVLADGSRVWLNAGSSIKFPLAFTDSERSVEVKGELYFEVMQDKKRPFKVYSGQQQLEVLGTHFNVNAYDDEEEIKTTLLEGAVKVSSGNISRILKPGQQSRLSGRTGEMNVVKVDLEEAISWKNGYFIFDNEDIHSVMRKISRWYGVEVVYANEHISENFGGTVSKFENVSQVLKILEATGTIHFKIEGRRIIVMQ